MAVRCLVRKTGYAGQPPCHHAGAQGIGLRSWHGHGHWRQGHSLMHAQLHLQHHLTLHHAQPHTRSGFHEAIEVHLSACISFIVFIWPLNSLARMTSASPSDSTKASRMRARVTSDGSPSARMLVCCVNRPLSWKRACFHCRVWDSEQGTQVQASSGGSEQ